MASLISLGIWTDPGCIQETLMKHLLWPKHVYYSRQLSYTISDVSAPGGGWLWHCHTLYRAPPCRKITGILSYLPFYFWSHHTKHLLNSGWVKSVLKSLQGRPSYYFVSHLDRHTGTTHQMTLCAKRKIRCTHDLPWGKATPVNSTSQIGSSYVIPVLGI